MTTGMLLLIGVARAACPLSSQLEDAVPRAVKVADTAIAALDTDALGAAMIAVEAAVRCQPTPILAADAADVHRVSGIAAFVTGDEAHAGAWFEAARAVDPTITLGQDIGGPLSALWDRSTTVTPAERRPLPRPLEGALLVDGTEAESAPAYLPFVLQHTLGTQVQAAWLQLPAAPLPDYPSRTLPKQNARSYAIAAGTSFVLSAVALTGAQSMRQRFNSPGTSYAEVEGLVRANRALGVTGYTLATVGVGLGAAALITVEF